jgi:hypothetical protein
MKRFHLFDFTMFGGTFALPPLNRNSDHHPDQNDDYESGDDSLSGIDLH